MSKAKLAVEKSLSQPQQQPEATFSSSSSPAAVPSFDPLVVAEWIAGVIRVLWAVEPAGR